MQFFRRGRRPLRVKLTLAGDFHDDIRGKVIRLTNPSPSDRNSSLDRKGTYMDGFSALQCGNVGDITAGLAVGKWTEEIARKLMEQNERAWDRLGIHGSERESRRRDYVERYQQYVVAAEPFYPCLPYPLIEWYSSANGRVVLELDSSQVTVVGQAALKSGEQSPGSRDRTDREAHPHTR